MSDQDIRARILEDIYHRKRQGMDIRTGPQEYATFLGISEELASFNIQYLMDAGLVKGQSKGLLGTTKRILAVSDLTSLGVKAVEGQVGRELDVNFMVTRKSINSAPGARGEVPEDNEKFMQMAIEEAKKSIPEDSRPHPKVGVVVVKDGKILASAHRGEISQGDHAEYTALERKLAQIDLTGATVYTTLEPCTTRNHPKTPCAKRIIERRVGKVVIGMLDPNPQIRGYGVYVLKDANIEVAFSQRELESQLKELNVAFVKAQSSADVGSEQQIDLSSLRREQVQVYSELFAIVSKIKQESPQPGSTLRYVAGGKAKFRVHETTIEQIERILQQKQYLMKQSTVDAWAQRNGLRYAGSGGMDHYQDLDLETFIEDVKQQYELLRKTFLPNL